MNTSLHCHEYGVIIINVNSERNSCYKSGGDSSFKISTTQ